MIAHTKGLDVVRQKVPKRELNEGMTQNELKFRKEYAKGGRRPRRRRYGRSTKGEFMVSGVSNGSSIAGNYDAAIMRKAKEHMELQGKQALKLIDSVNIDASPSKGNSIDVMA